MRSGKKPHHQSNWNFLPYKVIHILVCSYYPASLVTTFAQQCKKWNSMEKLQCSSPWKLHLLMVETLSWETWAGAHKLRRELNWLGRTRKKNGNCRCILWDIKYYWCELGDTLKIQPGQCFYLEKITYFYIFIGFADEMGCSVNLDLSGIPCNIKFHFFYTLFMYSFIIVWYQNLWQKKKRKQGKEVIFFFFLSPITSLTDKFTCFRTPLQNRSSISIEKDRKQNNFLHLHILFSV